MVGADGWGHVFLEWVRYRLWLGSDMREVGWF